MYQAIQHFLFLTHNWIYREDNGNEKRLCSICGLEETLQWTEDDKWDWVPGAITWLKSAN